MRYNRILAMLLLVFASLLAVACGAHTPTPKAAARPALVATPPTHCPGSDDYMGCSTSTRGSNPTLSFGAKPAGSYFPDVSVWQGHPDWAVAKSHIVGFAFKLGEYSEDPDAAYNAAESKRLGIPSVAYWFVRPSGCATEGSALEADAKALHVKRIVLDEEVSGISGYAACLNPYVRAATGQDAAVYRSSGNDYDDSAPQDACWVAAYGPSSTPSCGSRKVLAWQFTDGQYGFPTFIPGVPMGDVSVDHGLFATAHKPAPACRADAKAIAWKCLSLFITKPVKLGNQKLNERQVAHNYKAGQHTKRVKGQARLLADRINFIARHERRHGRWVKRAKPDWRFHRGFRRIRLARDAAGR